MHEINRKVSRLAQGLCRFLKLVVSVVLTFTEVSRAPRAQVLMLKLWTQRPKQSHCTVSFPLDLRHHVW